MARAGSREAGTSLPRRALLLSALAAAAGWGLPGAAAPLVLPAAAGDRRFSILYKGGSIGSHTVRYSAATGETRVRTDIHLTVKVAFFTLFAFSHVSEETWRDGRLMALRSETLEDGETLRVEGAATGPGFRVVGKGGPFIASAASLTSNSLWTPAMLEQETVVDAQHGGIIGVSARKLADEEILVGGRRVRTTRYALLTPYVAGSIWYDAANLWVHGEFEHSGATVQYRLDP